MKNIYSKNKIFKMTPPDSAFNNGAFMVPIILMLVSVLMIFTVMLLNGNIQNKKQGLSTISSTKAYFLAQAGIQHFKLKYKLLPEEFFKCAAVYHGYSPFYLAPAGKRFDQFDDQKNSAPVHRQRYPEYIAAFCEDINSFYDDRDVSVRKGKTIAGSAFGGSSRNGGFETWPLTMGGLDPNDAETGENLSGQGYKIISIKCYTMKVETDPKKLEKEKPYIEQVVTVETEGTISPNAGSLNCGETKEKKYAATETFIIKRRIDL